MVIAAFSAMFSSSNPENQGTAREFQETGSQAIGGALVAGMGGLSPTAVGADLSQSIGGPGL